MLFTDRDYRIDTDRKLVTEEIKQNNHESVQVTGAILGSQGKITKSTKSSSHQESKRIQDDGKNNSYMKFL